MSDIGWISFMADLRYWWLIYSRPAFETLWEMAQFLAIIYLLRRRN